MSPTVSVILTAWQRPHLLEEQVERVLDQSIKPCEVVLWYNAPPKRLGLFEKKQLLSFKNDKYVKKIICDHNFGIFPRFTLASSLLGEYVCIFDDDTMPGKRWFENCLEYVDEEQVMLGTIGLRYLSINNKQIQVESPRMGWEGMNESLERVDLVGHSWFFRREWAHYLWDQEPITRDFGEDMHFCAMLAKRGIGVACPPHPQSNKELWGSVKSQLGVDKVAISSQGSSDKPWQCVKNILENGYTPILHRGSK